MKSTDMKVVVALALLFAAWVHASDRQSRVTVVRDGGSAPARFVSATPLPAPPPAPVIDAPVEPPPSVRPVAETEPIADEVDEGLAPYPAWNGYDLDCPDVGHPVRVDGPDPHRLDRDGDGVGCEGQ